MDLTVKNLVDDCATLRILQQQAHGLASMLLRCTLKRTVSSGTKKVSGLHRLMTFMGLFRLASMTTCRLFVDNVTAPSRFYTYAKFRGTDGDLLSFVDTSFQLALSDDHPSGPFHQVSDRIPEGSYLYALQGEVEFSPSAT